MSSSEADCVRESGHQKTSGEHISSVLRALDILDYLESCQENVGVTEVGQVLGVHKSTASRLLSTMESKGYVQRDNATGKYSLGMRLVELARARLDRIDVRALARPFLEELVQKTGETAHLGVLDRGLVIYVDKVDTPQVLMMRSRIGYRVSPHCTALGKAILALLRDDEIDAVLKRQSFTRFTPNTITDPLTFKECLRQVRMQGFAIDDEEHEEGIICVASGVRDHAGRVVGAISVSGPTIRVTRQQLEEFGVQVRDACRRLSSSLGYSL